MFYLLLVSVIWAFSFGIIRVGFAGADPVLLAFLRLSLSLLIFVPFLGWRGLGWRAKGQLMGIGALQYGVMYGLLFSAFLFIGPRSYLIALFTLTTPIFVLVFAGVMERRPSVRGWLAAALAVAGAAIIQWRTELGQGFWKSFLLLQGSNAAFAFGQIAYRRVQSRLVRADPQLEDRAIFGWVFLGAVLLTGTVAAIQSDWGVLGTFDVKQWWALIYLGVVASGLCFFWWNRGATQVAPPTLAVLNNLKVPLAVIVSLLVFQEWRGVAWPQFILGSVIMAIAFHLSRERHQR